ncbi:uncharacterized protein J4E84_000372 [Alternaria hordeiaustralica]|uniref:uncharacterized protein n=1 Tax=Alternaria hordeiaustralica TaxID=1187925 RepID=UPI0020C2C0B9|nr:uncharacterized protein J4E84_000372 [Alternaria hordeiaustralica]KAI4697245.1 hypothetical protein J4E84_000372 [Alternaria hordeiaustralica]
MMQFANPTNDVIDTTVRKAYLSDICLTYSVLRPGMEILRDGSDKYSSKPDFLPPDTMDNDRRKDLKHSATPITSVDLLTAAAAVGNIEAVDHFIAQGADPLGYTSGILTGPIKAAAVCGHTPMVLKLVELARHDFPTLGARERDWILVTFETAVCHAMKAGDTESVRMLLEFFVTRREARIPEIWKKLITDGAQNGKTETLVTILKDDIPKRNPGDHHSDLQYALKEACEAGHSELVCRILGGDFVLFNRDHLIQQTSLEAARYGHRKLVVVLRSYGAHIGSQHLVEGMTTFADRATTHFLMTRHLVDAGVSIDAQVLKQCESKASFALRARHKMKQSHFCLTDGAMVTILIASEAKRQGLRAELKSCGSIKLLLRLVLNGKIIVPPEPLDFMKLAVEVVDWLASESQPAAS